MADSPSKPTTAQLVGQMLGLKKASAPRSPGAPLRALAAFTTPPRPKTATGAGAGPSSSGEGVAAAVLAKRQHLYPRYRECKEDDSDAEEEEAAAGAATVAEGGELPAGTTVATCIELPAKMRARYASRGEVAREPYALTVEGVLTAAECAELIEVTERLGYGAALVNVGGGRQMHMADMRNSERCIVDDAAAAELLWQRVKRFVPQTFGEGRRACARAVGLNERLRFLKYADGQYFAPHQDGSYVRGGEAAEMGPGRVCRRGEFSMVTLQLYLTAAAAEAPAPADLAHEAARFRGGATRFLCGWGDGDDGVDVVPAVGRALCFQHDLLHEGAIVRKPRKPLSGVDRGAFKYAIRTDVMYTMADGPIETLDYEHQPLSRSE